MKLLYLVYRGLIILITSKIIPIFFEEFINLKDLFDNDLEDLQFKFKLFATIHHIGSIDTGHYYVIIRKDNE